MTDTRCDGDELDVAAKHIDLLATALEKIEGMQCLLAVPPYKNGQDPDHFAGDGRYACIELETKTPCATCQAHEALALFRGR